MSRSKEKRYYINNDGLFSDLRTAKERKSDILIGAIIKKRKISRKEKKLESPFLYEFSAIDDEAAILIYELGEYNND